MIGLSGLSTVIAVIALAFVFIYLLQKGFSSISWTMLTCSSNALDPTKDGLRNEIVGSLILLGVACVIGLPAGILGGVYQVESKGPFASTIRFLTDVLNSIPSVVIGLFVYVLVVAPVAHYAQVHNMQDIKGYCALAGGVALGILMIPTVMKTTEEILRLVPVALREGSLALGATRSRTMFSIVLPAARNGIITGVMLAIARVAGETAPLVFTAFGNTSFSVDLLQPISSLPWSIWVNTQAGDPVSAAKAYAGALILITLILIMSLLARWATRGSMMDEK
jgi:phosphate transport system permease protein